MITRTAIFEGKILPGKESEFYQYVENILLPLWERFPHASNVRYYKISSADEGAPPFVLIQQIDYPSVAHLDEALQSAIRSEARDKTMVLLDIFAGRFYHFISQH